VMYKLRERRDPGPLGAFAPKEQRSWLCNIRRYCKLNRISVLLISVITSNTK